MRLNESHIGKWVTVPVFWKGQYELVVRVYGENVMTVPWEGASERTNYNGDEARWELKDEN